MQNDGNFVIYRTYGSDGVSIWSTGTSGTGPGNHIKLTHDAELIIYKSSGSVAWRADALYEEWPISPARLVMQNDGNLVLIVDHMKIWSSKTANW